MEIIKITPRAFRKGVVDAWAITKKSRSEYPNHKIFMIGQLVHKKDMFEEVSKYGIVTMDDANFVRLSIIKQIAKENVKDKIVVIISAHGKDYVVTLSVVLVQTMSFITTFSCPVGEKSVCISCLLCCGVV